LSDRGDQDYFAAGLTDDLITELSKVSGLFVIARNSVFALGDQAGVQEAASELGVQYVLEGTFRRTKSTIRINTQLIDVSTGRYMWAERYDRDSKDLFFVQDDVIDHIISTMSVHLTAAERSELDRIPTANLEAYDNYLRAEQEGVYFTDVESYRRALSYYQRAIELDPNFAEAHAGIARIAVDVWGRDYNFLWSAAVARKIAYDAAGRALELDPRNARGHSVLALLQLVDGRREEAATSARKAVDLKPNDAEAHGNLGLVLVHSGELEAGVAEVDAALRLDPAPTPFFDLLAGVIYYNARNYARAIEQLEPARKALPQSEPAREYLAAAYARHGDEAKALLEIGSLLEMFPAANLAYYDYLYGYWLEEQRAHHLEGLRRAGIPEWPFGFEADEADRLNEVELSALIDNTTWTGRHRNGTPFMQHFDGNGNVAYQSANTFATGLAYLRADRLCQRLDGIVPNQPICGYVYRNSVSDTGRNEDYVQVSPNALQYFSLEEPPG
ncbi:MAG: tetratricopeptide repeat protein, partial [Geminicoccaceae bacterium]